MALPLLWACDFAGGKGPLTQTDMSPGTLSRFGIFQVGTGKGSSQGTSRSELSGQNVGQRGRPFNSRQEEALRAKCGPDPDLIGFMTLEGELKPKLSDLFLEDMEKDLTDTEMEMLLRILVGDPTAGGPQPTPFLVKQHVSLCIPRGENDVKGWGIQNNMEYDFEEASYDGSRLRIRYSPELLPQDIPAYLKKALPFLNQGVFTTAADLEVTRFVPELEQTSGRYEVNNITTDSKVASEWFKKLFESGSKFEADPLNVRVRWVGDPTAFDNPDLRNTDEEPPLQETGAEVVEKTDVVTEEVIQLKEEEEEEEEEREEREIHPTIPLTFVSAPAETEKEPQVIRNEGNKTAESRPPVEKSETPIDFGAIVDQLLRPAPHFGDNDNLTAQETDSYVNARTFTLANIRKECADLPLQVTAMIHGIFWHPLALDKDQSEKQTDFLLKICAEEREKPEFRLFLHEVTPENNPNLTGTLPPREWYAGVKGESDVLFARDGDQTRIAFTAQFRRMMGTDFIVNMIETPSIKKLIPIVFSDRPFLKNRLTLQGVVTIREGNSPVVAFSRLPKTPPLPPEQDPPSPARTGWDFRIEVPDEALELKGMKQIPPMFGTFTKFKLIV